jgi:hypothetical protein
MNKPKIEKYSFVKGEHVHQDTLQYISIDNCFDKPSGDRIDDGGDLSDDNICRVKKVSVIIKVWY